jgi:DivIVA domain-containing protein
MPLSPAEVHNVAFKKSQIGKRGYDEEEVDAFLDVVEVELTRLIEENNDLQVRFGNGRTTSAPAAFTTGGAPPNDAWLDEAMAELTAVRAENQRLQAHVAELEGALSQGKHGAQQQVVQLQRELMQVHEQFEQAQQEAAEARQAAEVEAQSPEAPVSAQALQLLAFAQETADKHLANAKQEAERLLAEAQASSASAIGSAQEQAQRHLSEAEARAKHLEEESTAHANRTVQAAEERAAAITGRLEQQTVTLQHRVEELGAFEREYRSRLKSYLESQLRDLDVNDAGDRTQHADLVGSPQG